MRLRETEENQWYNLSDEMTEDTLYERRKRGRPMGFVNLAAIFGRFARFSLVRSPLRPSEKSKKSSQNYLATFTKDLFTGSLRYVIIN